MDVLIYYYNLMYETLGLEMALALNLLTDTLLFVIGTKACWELYKES